MIIDQKLSDGVFAPPPNKKENKLGLSCAKLSISWRKMAEKTKTAI